MAKHHEALDRVLVDVANGNKRRVIVMEPPRHGKSEHGSKYFPSWFLGKFPTKHVVLGSATTDLATEFSLAARDIHTQYAETVFGHASAVRADARASSNWKTVSGGSMRAIGVGSGIMGRGADLFIVDDYFSNFNESLSKAERNSRHTWLRGTVDSRLEPDASVLIMCTPYHLDELP